LALLESRTGVCDAAIQRLSAAPQPLILRQGRLGLPKVYKYRSCHGNNDNKFERSTTSSTIKMTISATKNMNRSRKTDWSGKVLIPMWTIQIAAILAIIIGYIWFLATYNRLDYSLYYYDTVTKRSAYTQLLVPEKTVKVLTINAQTDLAPIHLHSSQALVSSYYGSSVLPRSFSRLSDSTRKIYLPQRCWRCRLHSVFSRQSHSSSKSWDCSLSSWEV
jgi:hypothetical protein